MNQNDYWTNKGRGVGVNVKLGKINESLPVMLHASCCFLMQYGNHIQRSRYFILTVLMVCKVATGSFTFFFFFFYNIMNYTQVNNNNVERKKVLWPLVKIIIPMPMTFHYLGNKMWQKNWRQTKSVTTYLQYNKMRYKHTLSVFVSLVNQSILIKNNYTKATVITVCSLPSTTKDTTNSPI